MSHALRSDAAETILTLFSRALVVEGGRVVSVRPSVRQTLLVCQFKPNAYPLGRNVAYIGGMTACILFCDSMIFKFSMNIFVFVLNVFNCTEQVGAVGEEALAAAGSWPADTHCTLSQVARQLRCWL